MVELQAQEFALKCHSGQKYGNREYSFHLESVVQIARKFDLPEDVVASCWLHDTLEDCDITYQDLKKNFGENIAEIVYSVTDELGRNRIERKSKTYPKIKANEDAVCVKLCDRIANLRQALIDDNRKLITMYMNEKEEFEQHLYSADQSDRTLALWKELESLMSAINS